MAPQIFGLEHILYDVVVLAVMLLVFLVVRRLKAAGRDTSAIVRILGGVLFLCILWNRVSICLDGGKWGEFLPGTFCGASSLALALLAMFGRRDNAALHCVAYTGLLGGILTLVYPDFIGQSDSIFYSKTISGLTHHAVTVLVVLVMLYTGFLAPSVRKYHYLPLGLCVYMTYGIFCISVLGYGDAMYIFEPILPDTALTWPVLGVIFLALHLIFLLLWGYISKKINARKTEKSAL